MTSPLTKSQIRRQFDRVRRSMDPETVRRLSEQIAQHAVEVSAIRTASTLHTYWPITDQNEVDTRPLIDDLQERGVAIVLPVVTSFEAGTPEMTHRRFTGRASLQTNTWGIPEPVEGDPVPLASIDAVVVPALGAGLNGHRIGHGWGYYDAFLAKLSPDIPRIVLAFDACVRPGVPHESHDVPVDVIVTETGAHSVSTAASPAGMEAE
jgi:5-formyltetrahydrofolate cyclo-ligase